MIDLADYYSGGYFLIRADKPDWEQLKTDLLPEKLLSLSTCICPRIGVSWGWIMGDREAALKFGVPEEKLEDFVEWCAYGHKPELDIWSMFYSPDMARRFIERFLPDASDLHLIGVGLHQSLEAENWRELNEDENIGINKQVEQRLPLAKGGTPLGFEILSFSYNDFGHSWICSGIYEDMYALYGIRPGQYGLIQSREDAEKVYEWIAEDDQKGHRAEPEPYDYWLLVNYPLTS